MSPYYLASRWLRHCKPRFAVIATAWLLTPLHAEHAAAQIGAGTLSGRIVDAATGEPLEDVVVTATSPQLQVEQIVVTDASGTFRIPNLPPGEYTLNYQADTYRPYTSTDIELTAGSTLRVDAQLLPEMLRAEEVTVVATPPTVDVGSARSGVTVDQEFTSRIAVAPPTGKGGAARSFEQLAQVAPTASTDMYGASISGTTSVENQYMIDGLSVGDPGFGYNSTPLSIDFIKETNVITGGYLPEYGRGGGGVLEAITKSGSNEFHGSVFGNVTPLQLNPQFAPAQDAIRTTSKLDSVRDFGFDLGGPLIKDKLWFYVGADLSRQTYKLTRDLIALEVGNDGAYLYDDNGLIRSNAIPGTRRTTPADQTSLQYIGKLTWSPTADDRIELTHFGTPTHGGGDGKYSVDYQTGSPLVFANPVAQGSRQVGPYDTMAWRQIFDSYDTSLRWTHAMFNKRLTFDTILGWHHQHSANLAADGSEIGSGNGLSGMSLFGYGRTAPFPHPITDFETLPDPSVCTNPVAGGDAICPAASYNVGGPQILHDRIYNRYQGRELATLVAEGLGHHIIKAGAQVEFADFDYAASYPGGPALREDPNGITVRDGRRYGGLTAPDEAYTLPALRYKVSSISFGAFLQDSWSVMDKITVNAGMRYDTQSLYTEGGDLGLTLPNQWSPRVGVIFDPTQSGRAKLFANYAIYYQSIPMSIMTRAGAGEPQVIARRPLSACDPVNTPDYPNSCDDPNQLVSRNGPAGPNDKWYLLGIGRTAIDPDLKPQSTDEISAGGEYEVLPGGRLGLTYIHRSARTVMEDMSRDEGSTYFVGNPGHGLASDFPEAKRTFDAAILHFTKTFSHHWLAQASYTLSYLRGNWEGLFRPQTGQLDPGTNSDFDLRSLTVNRNGPLSADRRHGIKLFVARDLELAKQHHMTVGVSYRASSGAPTNYLGGHVLYGNDEVFLLPRGSGERLPWVHDFDLKLAYTFFESPTKTLSVTLDIFNIFNFQAVTARSQRYTQRSVQPITGKTADQVLDANGDINSADITAADDDPRPFEDADRYRAFGAPVRYQPPLTVRFGIKGTF